MTPNQKIKVKNKLVAIGESIFNLPRFLITVAFILARLASIDFFDLGLHQKWAMVPNGWFHLTKPEIYFSFIGNILLLMAFASSLLSNRESRRNTSFQLRPYVRFEWISQSETNDRAEQGIRNTCLVLINDGNGLMRNVKYQVWINGANIPVRNHSIITASGIPTKVVYDKSFTDSPL